MQFVVLALSVFILDQLSKYMIQQALVEGQSIPVIQDIFHLTLFKNPGAAFGIFANKTLFFIIVTSIVMVIIIYIYRHIPKKKFLARTALALQFGGAAGNLVDRLISGKVVDFIDFRIWPVFNIADTAIVIGIILLGLEVVRWKETDAESEQ